MFIFFMHTLLVAPLMLDSYGLTRFLTYTIPCSPYDAVLILTFVLMIIH